ncbi:UDP-glucose 4-epimerase [Candidatus Gottesmanbacteria bacterium RIFCSPHIGHO2_02_FULL_39_11]|uniref:UDP-glucose 4-epimerase n=1 Tax=Candidatus Gottesmanbacteria bacterium RIFCSPHIGHO2_02_FULL_39_11 TaxID=1798382 RepID=A0A1F5ZL49_9BACT|nr:MAG: UDP-glucose 4-epimerase [Candidatus Gottesmanbacteria bacterium RIFCSPHIGHO2_02_FULL_39_11]
MKILVTGGAGFIASHIADRYIEKGHSVVVLDNLSSGKREYVHPKAVFYQCDIRKYEEVERVISCEKPEIINHHAAQISVRKSVEDPPFDAEVNLVGLLNLLEAGRKNGLKKVVFASSGGVVYGDAQVLPTPEDYTPLQPLSPYGVAKLASEYYLFFYKRTYGISFVALRYGNVYGPRQNPHGEAGVVAIFSKKLIKGESPTINGDGKQTRDYVYVEDVVHANVLALASSAEGAFNIGTGQESNVLTIFSTLKDILKSSLTPIHGPAKQGEQKRSCLNNSKAKKQIKWTPQFTLQDGLERTVDYFKTESNSQNEK